MISPQRRGAAPTARLVRPISLHGPGSVISGCRYGRGERSSRLARLHRHPGVLVSLGGVEVRLHAAADVHTLARGPKKAVGYTMRARSIMYSGGLSRQRTFNALKLAGNGPPPPQSPFKRCATDVEFAHPAERVGKAGTGHDLENCRSGDTNVIATIVCLRICGR